MKNQSGVGKCDSKRTLQSQWLNNEQLNDSLDMDSEDDVETTATKTNKAHFLRSPFPDRPSTLFFQYPKCCGIENEENKRVVSIEKVHLTYKIYGSEYKCIVNSL